MAMQIIEQGPRNLVISFQGVGPDTVNVSNLAPPCEDLRIMKVQYDAPNTPTAPSTIAGVATANLTLVTLHGHSETICFEDVGGLPNNAGAGKTGNILVTKGDASTTLVVWFKKVRTVMPK